MTEQQTENRRLAHIVNGVVTNVSLSNGTTGLEYRELMIVLPEGSDVGIGWDYIDGVFVDNRPGPEYPPEP